MTFPELARALLEAEEAVEKVEHSWQPIGPMDPEDLRRWHILVTRALRRILEVLQAFDAQAEQDAIDRLADARVQRLRQQMGGNSDA